MGLIILSAICLAATNLFCYHKYRTERKQHRKVRVRKDSLHQMVAALNDELLTYEQKLNELEDLVFDHVSILEEREMEAFDIECTQPLVRWVGTRREVEEARKKLTF